VIAETPPRALRFNTILVPHDFSRVSDLALAHAVEFLGVRRGVIHLLHAVTPVVGVPTIDGALQITSSRLVFDSQRVAEERLRRLIASLHAGVEIHVAFGSPADVICGFARQIGADLIVMGVRERRV
jgi:nucleotide-binding universal stress UspA family protein